MGHWPLPKWSNGAFSQTMGLWPLQIAINGEFPIFLTCVIYYHYFYYYNTLYHPHDIINEQSLGQGHLSFNIFWMNLFFYKNIDIPYFWRKLMSAPCLLKDFFWVAFLANFIILLFRSPKIICLVLRFDVLNTGVGLYASHCQLRFLAINSMVYSWVRVVRTLREFGNV